MKKYLLLAGVFLAGCQLIPIPNDFPPRPPTTIKIMPPPSTVIVELPVVTVTPTLALRVKPVMNTDRSDALTFVYLIKTMLLAGDDYGFAEVVHYPIEAMLNGQKTTFYNRDEFGANARAILIDKLLPVLEDAHENDLLILPDGVRVRKGELWFNQFCMDAACTDTQFLVTQINN